jgi:glycosyltransferase involved in cell wall biosynthesis
VRVAVVVKTNIGATWIVPQVREMTSRGHEVLVVVADEDGPLAERVQAVGAQVHRSGAVGGTSIVKGLVAYPRMLRRLRKFRPDVVCSHLYRSTLVVRSAAPFVRAPRVHTVPGPLFLESPWIRRAERILQRLDSAVVATADVVDTRYADLGVPDERRFVVPYGVDLQVRQPATEQQRLDARRALDIDPDERLFVCVAYFYAAKRLVLDGEDIKGHDVLLEAWRRHVSAGGRGTLLLVGGGFGPAGETRREALLAEYESTPGLVTIDSVDDVSPIYLAADVSVAPSRSENLGSAAEACAYGVPSIASNVGGLPQLVIPGSTGWLVPPNDIDALQQVLGVVAHLPQATIGEMSRNARSLAEEQLDLDVCTARYVDFVEGVAGSD